VVSDNNVADEVVHAADSFFASRTDIRPDGLEVAQTEAVATVRLAGGLGLLASDAPEELGGGGGEPLYAGLIAESAGRNLIHPLILHQLGCVAYLTTSLESEKLSKEFALGHKIGLFAWHQAPTTRASVPGAIAKPDYAVIHTQGRGAFVAPSGSLGVEMSTEDLAEPTRNPRHTCDPASIGRVHTRFAISRACFGDPGSVCRPLLTGRGATAAEWRSRVCTGAKAVRRSNRLLPGGQARAGQCRHRHQARPRPCHWISCGIS